MASQRNEELFTLARNFSIISKATVAIFDANCDMIAAWPRSSAPFCDMIRRNSKMINDHCNECDIMGFSKCCAAKKPYLYHCHLGLVEIAAPIIFGETLLGYILIGQFTDKPDKEPIRRTILEYSKKYGFSAAEALEKLDDIVYLSAEYSAALTQLIEMCANYIWLNHIIKLNESHLAHEIRLYIADHLTEDLSVDSLCTKFGFSATTLYQLFKKAFGSGVNRVIREERIKKAKELLFDSKLSIGDAASLVGILDTNYFTRIFKAETGITPREFRRTGVADTDA